MDPELKLDVKITLKDYHEFRKQVVYQTLKSINGFLKLVIPLSIVLLFVYVIHGIHESYNASQGLEDGFYGSIMIYGVILMIILMLPYQFKKQSKKIYKSALLLQAPRQYFFNEKGFKIYSSNGEGFVEWEKVFKVKENKKFILIYISAVQVHILPKTCFENEEQMAKLKRIMKEQQKFTS